MINKMERLMVSIPAEVKNELDTIKRQQFYDKPYAELYRYIIHLGLEKMKETGAAKSQRNPTKQLVNIHEKKGQYTIID